MYGVVTRNAEETTWREFDTAFYEAMDVSGRSSEPIPDAVNMVSCFGDNATAEADPTLVPVNADGLPATRDRPYFDWAYICPSHEGYRGGLLEIIEGCAAANSHVRLDDVGFPRQGYCRCDRCRRLFAASEHEKWVDWRADVITAFVRQATERIPGRTFLTLYPDPYPGHLRTRSGIDLDALEAYVDEFVVPLYDMAYSTTYWLEALASGFTDATDSPISVELYAVDVDVNNLVNAAAVADAYSRRVLFAYDASTAREVIRRLRTAGDDGAHPD